MADDFGFIPEDELGFIPEATPASDTEFSALEAFGQGALDTASLGFSDEAIGGAKAAYDALLGKLGDKSFKESYKEYRDIEREKQKAAQEQQGGAYATGSITGAVGSAFIPGLGGATAGKTLGQLAAQGAKLGGAFALGGSEAELTDADPEQLKQAALETAKGATIGGATGVLFPKLFSKDVYGRSASTKQAIEQGAKALALGGALGGTMGAATSEGDLTSEEGREQLAADALKGAGFGALGGLASRAALGTARRIGDTKLSKTAQLAFKEGRKGINVGEGSGYTKAQIDEMNKLAEDATQKIQTLKNKASDAVDKATQEADDMLQKQSLAASETNKQAVAAAEDAVYKQTKKLDSLMKDSKSNIDNGIEEVNKLLETKGVKFNFNKPIVAKEDGSSVSLLKNLSDTLENNGIIDPEQKVKLLEPLIRKIKPDMDINDVREVRRYFNTFMESDNPAVRGAFKQAYGNVNRLIESTIDDAAAAANDISLSQAGSNLKELNKKFYEYKQLEELFGMTNKVLPQSQQAELKGSQAKMLKNLIRPEAEYKATQEALEERLPFVAGDKGKGFIDETKQVVRSLEDLKKVKVEPITKEQVQKTVLDRAAKDAPLKQQMELQKSLNMLEDSIGKIDPESQNASRSLVKLIAEADFIDDPNKAKDFDKVIDTLKRNFGEDVGENFKQKALELSKKFKLGVVTEEDPAAQLHGVKGLKHTITGPLAGFVSEMSNTLGKTVNVVSGAAPKKLSVNSLADKAASKGFKALSNQLKDTTNRDHIGRQATLFSISQNPKLRQQYNEVLGKDQEEE